MGGLPGFRIADERDIDAATETIASAFAAGASQKYLRETLERFEAVPREAPHYHLSPVGTHRDRRCRGIGMALLAHPLAGLDAGGHAAHLESTNTANLDRHRSVGFTDLGGFSLPDDGPYITTMWRPARHDNDSDNRDRATATTEAEER